MNRWLARLALSFFVVAAVLLWDAHQRVLRSGADAVVIAQVIGGAVCIVLGIVGTRARHRL